MKYLFVFATIMVSCMAAPTNTNTATLDRPSPINPSVLSETKPGDKIVPIKDEKPTEVKKPFVPTVVPAVVTHHDIKNDHKAIRDSHVDSNTNVGDTLKSSHSSKDSEHSHRIIPEKSATINQRSRRDVQTSQPSNDKKPLGFQKPQTLPAVIPNDQHKAHEHNVPIKPQTFPVHTVESKHHKRDVPLVPKETPTEVSSKNEENSKQKKDEVQKEEHKPIVIPHTVQVEDISQPKPVSHKHSSSAQHHAHEFHPQTKHPNSEEKKPITLQEVQQKPVVPSVAPTTSDIKENPVIRKKPVPVSELFSRPHNN